MEKLKNMFYPSYFKELTYNNIGFRQSERFCDHFYNHLKFYSSLRIETG